MKSVEKILDFEIRKRIYNIISEKPGLHLRELERENNISFGCLRYHLDYLKKRDLIKNVKDGGFIRYFVTNSVGNGDKLLLNIFRQETLRKLIIIFLSNEERRFLLKEDINNIPAMKKFRSPEYYKISKHRTTIEFYLKKLIDAKILKIVKVKNENGYKLVEYEKILDFMVRYNEALPYIDVKNTVSWIDEYGIPWRIKSVEDTIWEIFPHPYHC